MIKFPEMSHEEKLKHCMEYALGSLKLYTECPKGGTESYPNTWQEVKLAHDMIDFLTDCLEKHKLSKKLEGAVEIFRSIGPKIPEDSCAEKVI